MKSLRRIHNRDGRCYELSFKVMAEEPGAENFTLVHGTVRFRENGFDIDHAWIEVGDGRIYDPTLDCYVTPVEFKTRRPTVQQRYLRTEMLKLADETRHFGPWNGDDPGYKGGRIRRKWG